MMGRRSSRATVECQRIRRVAGDAERVAGSNAGRLRTTHTSGGVQESDMYVMYMAEEEEQGGLGGTDHLGAVRAGSFTAFGGAVRHHRGK